MNSNLIPWARWILSAVLILSIFAGPAQAGRSEATSPVARKARISSRQSGTPSKIVGKDAAGDWSIAGWQTLGALGDALGQDLIAASLSSAPRTTLNFEFSFSSLPAEPLIEQNFYLWGFAVDGEPWFITTGCNPYAPEQCPDSLGKKLGFQVCRCDESLGPLRTCTTLGSVAANINLPAATISVSVPLDLIRAGKGSVIEAGDFPVAVGPAREVQLKFGGALLMGDELLITKKYVVP